MGWKYGVLVINGTPYIWDCSFEQNDEYGKHIVIDLHASNRRHYRLVIDPQGNPSCDCPDATYRQREGC